MSVLTIALRSSQEARVRQRAEALGLPVDRYIERLLEEDLRGEGVQKALSQEEVDTFFRELREISSSVRDFPDPNFGRGALYQDHD